eukprot:CAMPEP_0201985246 /NCGR_PEP_ID=MMETSP0904-20121228/86379_1 /ASSEMBLY_ACC=CAM_ASM_000553 /TAXON_ID=420261 /ORGANISM="Thalassiosira antarctica, Strain CCMP982" /LENGTH=137 /DNA_ID=CAMNT_0048538863 /DNA_START=180 /DNA_END=590 /DNA_ORIENTATION=+
MSTPYPPRCRAVRFSQFSEVVVFPHEIMDSNAYSPADVRRFKQDLISDARVMARLLATSPAVMITEDDLLECIGIELFLKRGLARQAKERKQAHLNAIIAGQYLFSEEELANLSAISSRWAQGRAVNCAANYSGFSH